ncbi:DUF732 domain-containing protein [Microbacterium sp. NPDC080220]|uniref:DUF732 domain-containing protein n=1 Tax=Microbacterium sp. NPDC080220 TaxID=3161017 RepID=UPI00344868F8
MRARAGIITAGFVALALTGCSGAVGGEPEAVETTPPASSAPLTAGTPASAPSGEAAYLEAVREALPADTVIPDATDEQLIAAGEEACAVLADGGDTVATSLIEGEPTSEAGYYNDSSAIFTAAAISLCD